jgi:hypothetical protein
LIYSDLILLVAFEHPAAPPGIAPFQLNPHFKHGDGGEERMLVKTKNLSGGLAA